MIYKIKALNFYLVFTIIIVTPITDLKWIPSQHSHHQTQHCHHTIHNLLANTVYGVNLIFVFGRLACRFVLLFCSIWCAEFLIRVIVHFNKTHDISGTFVLGLLAELQKLFFILTILNRLYYPGSPLKEKIT